MPTKIATFSEAVHAQLRRQDQPLPSVEGLNRLFETMYFASMRTEEGHSIKFHIVYLDPENPDPFPPKRLRRVRWSVSSLQAPIPATVSNLVKLASASDPRTSSLATFEYDGEMRVWGLIDQGNSYHDFVTNESDSGPERPGVFQTSILGVGKLVAFRGYSRLAELHIDKLMPRPLDVLSNGPIREALNVGIEEFVLTVTAKVQSSIQNSRIDWAATLSREWIATLSRLLLRMRGYNHGGAILITPDESNAHLKLKYHLSYDRLRTTLRERSMSRILRDQTRRKISRDYIHRESSAVPRDLYLTSLVSGKVLYGNR